MLICSLLLLWTAATGSTCSDVGWIFMSGARQYHGRSCSFNYENPKVWSQLKFDSLCSPSVDVIIIFFGSSFSNLMIWCFYLSYCVWQWFKMKRIKSSFWTVGQIKQENEDITVSSQKLWRQFFHIFIIIIIHYISQPKHLIEKVLSRLIDNENNC